MTTPEPSGRLFQTLYHVARTVNSSLDIMQVLQTIVASTAEALEARACSLRLLGPDGKHLMFGAAHGLSAAYRAKGPVLLEHSASGRTGATGRLATVVIDDAGGDPPFPVPGRTPAKKASFRCWSRRCGCRTQPIGVLRVYYRERPARLANRSRSWPKPSPA